MIIEPFALLALGSTLRPLAGVVTQFETERSILDPIGRARLSVLATELGDDYTSLLDTGEFLELWYGDLQHGQRWPVFRGYVDDINWPPTNEIEIRAVDYCYHLAVTEVPAPQAAQGRPMSHWVEVALELAGGPGVHQTSLDLPTRLPLTRTDSGHVSWPQRAESIKLAEFLDLVGERYGVREHLGEDISYYITIDNEFVWQPWVDPGASSAKIAWGNNLLNFMAGQDGSPHLWECTPLPWLHPGQTFDWEERPSDVRLAGGRFRADTVRHTFAQGWVRTEVYSDRRVG